ncbi:hypothetical protein ACVV2G_13145 [Streptomyces ziwulingensis]
MSTIKGKVHNDPGQVLGEEESKEPGRLVRERDLVVVDKPVDQLPADVPNDELTAEGRGGQFDGRLPGVAVAAGPGEEAVYPRAAGRVVVQPGVQKVLGACAEGDVLGWSQLSSRTTWVT